MMADPIIKEESVSDEECSHLIVENLPPVESDKEDEEKQEQKEEEEEERNTERTLDRHINEDTENLALKDENDLFEVCEEWQGQLEEYGEFATQNLSLLELEKKEDYEEEGKETYGETVDHKLSNEVTENLVVKDEKDYSKVRKECEDQEKECCQLVVQNLPQVEYNEEEEEEEEKQEYQKEKEERNKERINDGHINDDTENLALKDENDLFEVCEEWQGQLETIKKEELTDCFKENNRLMSMEDLNKEYILPELECPKEQSSEFQLLKTFNSLPLSKKTKPTDKQLCPKCKKPLTHSHLCKMHVCDVCQKGFIRYYQLKVHMRMHRNEKPYQCETCQKGFIVRSHLNDHMKTHTKEKPYLCEVCQKGFAHIASFKGHLRTHTKEKPFCCGLCGKCFTHRSALTVHIRTHRQDKPFLCDVCKKRFSQKAYLKDHMKTHTKEKPYICEVCEKGFVSSSHLKNHMRTHTNEKPYLCEVCKKGFSQTGQVKDHMKTHTKEKPFSCEECGKFFAWKKSLNVHMKSHGGPCVNDNSKDL